MACLLDWGPALAAALFPIVKIVAYLAAIQIFVGQTYNLSATIVREKSNAPLGTLAKCLVLASASSLPLLAVCIVTATFLAMESMPPSAIGLSLHSGATAEVVRAMGAAFIGILIVFAVGQHAGWILAERSDVATDLAAGLPRFCGGAAYTITGSIFEEIMLRGYTYTILNGEYGSLVAVIGSAAVFAVMHAVVHRRLPGLYLLNCFLFGIAAAYCRFTTGSLWAAIGLHIGWNLPSISVFGFPFQGIANRRGIFACSVSGPKNITGGDYSPDGGLLGVLALCCTALVLVFLVLPPWTA